MLYRDLYQSAIVSLDSAPAVSSALSQPITTAFETPLLLTLPKPIPPPSSSQSRLSLAQVHGTSDIHC